VTERAIMDTGPLVAFLDRSEAHHAWAAGRFRQFSVPLFTCEPVLTECLFLLRLAPVAQDKLLELVERRSLVVDFRLQEELGPVRRLMAKYRDAPMSLADACLVRMAETTGLSVCTLDSHFAVYRKHGRDSLALISPEG
jgi:predicted nucleic acid-binding protein